MPRIAVLSDIHGNLPALEAVCADLSRREVSTVFNLGDHASGPLWPAETLDLLMRQPWLNIAGETPAEAVVRETLEETGVHCQATALVGVYDSRLWDKGRLQHVYKFTFLCEPVDEHPVQSFDQHDTLETGWFTHLRFL